MYRDESPDNEEIKEIIHSLAVLYEALEVKATGAKTGFKLYLDAIDPSIFQNLERYYDENKHEKLEYEEGKDWDILVNGIESLKNIMSKDEETRNRELKKQDNYKNIVNAMFVAKTIWNELEKTQNQEQTDNNIQNDADIDRTSDLNSSLLALQETDIIPTYEHEQTVENTQELISIAEFDEKLNEAISKEKRKLKEDEEKFKRLQKEASDKILQAEIFYADLAEEKVEFEKKKKKLAQDIEETSEKKKELENLKSELVLKIKEVDEKKKLYTIDKKTKKENDKESPDKAEPVSLEKDLRKIKQLELQLQSVNDGLEELQRGRSAFHSLQKTPHIAFA